LEKEQKFKTKLHVRKNENSEVLIELKIIKQNINNMEKHNKDLEIIKVDKDSLHATLKQTYANYWKLKT
jgi:hypothetical protein